MTQELAESGGGASSPVRPAMPGRLAPPRGWLMWLGFAALAIPTLLTMARISWSSENGAHGPIVLATGLWLLYRGANVFAAGRPMPALPWALALLPLLALYMFGRVTSILALETLALYCTGLTLVALQYGLTTIRRLWFPFFYLLFLIVPPENWMVVGTQPIKLWLSTISVDLLAWFGYAVGRSGVIIQIDGYQLLVATACSGVNSLIGICAISLFYVYLRHGSAPRYALLLTAMLLPVAIFANLLRVITLILMTHYWGEEVAQGVMHEVAGMGIFMVSLLLLLAFDSLLQPIGVRLGLLEAER